MELVTETKYILRKMNSNSIKWYHLAPPPPHPVIINVEKWGYEKSPDLSFVFSSKHPVLHHVERRNIKVTCMPTHILDINIFLEHSFPRFVNHSLTRSHNNPRPFHPRVCCLFCILNIRQPRELILLIFLWFLFFSLSPLQCLQANQVYTTRMAIAWL